MTALVFFDCGRDKGAALTRTLRENVDGVTWEACHDLKQLATALSRPGQEWAVVVVAASSVATLATLEPFKDQLAHLGLLLILPDQDDALVAMGHRLAPRLLVGGEDAPAISSLVLNQMLNKQQTPARKRNGGSAA